MARTIRQQWQWAVGAVLCASLFSACQHFGGRGSDRDRQLPSEEPGKRANKADRVPPGLEEGPPRLPEQPSPYHEVGQPSSAPEKRPTDVQVHQAIYPPLPEVSPTVEESRPARITQTGASADNRPSAGQVLNLNDKPRPESPLLASLRCFMEKRPNDAIALLQRYDKPNQEMLLCLLPLAVRLAGPSLNQAKLQELTTVAEQLRSLELSLRPRTELVIDKMVFCEQIKGFGVYKPLPEGHAFQMPLQGRSGELVQVYVELSNLSTTLRGNLYETRLASAVDIRPAGSKKSWWHHDFKDRNRLIRSLTLRHDFFNSYSFYVPHIDPGNYDLTIQVIDVPTGRKAEKTLPFRVTTLPGRD